MIKQKGCGHRESKVGIVLAMAGNAIGLGISSVSLARLQEMDEGPLSIRRKNEKDNYTGYVYGDSISDNQE